MRKVTVPLNDEPAFTPKRKRGVVIFGAGYSGLIFAHKLRYVRKEADAVLEYIISKAKDSIGDTGVDNVYPVVQWDAPSAIYAFPFDPNPEWSHFYSSGQGILKYMQKAVKMWGGDRDILSTRKSYRQSGTNLGLDHGFDYSYKHIGVIGNGSSGIQILPQIAKLEGTTVTSFQRGPTWVSSRLSPAALLGNEDQSPNPEYWQEDKQRLRDPDQLREYRKKVQGGVNKASKLFIKGSDANKAVTGFAVEQMSENFNYNPELCEKRVPKWELGCRRITPWNEYLKAFTRKKTKLTNPSISAIIEGGIQTEDGTHHGLDVIICATGFDVSQNTPYSVIGRDDIKLVEKWKGEPESYLSLACPSTPHYFIFTGPNSTVGHGNLIQSIVCGAEWMMQWLMKMSAENIASVAPKQDVVNEFVRYGDQIHRTLTWTGGCRSWYKNGRLNGRLTATWPRNVILYHQMGQRIRPKDLDIRCSSSNRLGFMGNGFTQYGLQERAGLAYYLTT